MSPNPDPLVVGFDFGTTNSLMSVVRQRGPINFLDADQLPIPSVVCYEGNRTIVGRAARERLSTSGLGVHGNTIRSPKLFLGKDSVFLEGVERSPVDVVADLIAHVRTEAVKAAKARRLDLAVDKAVVTIPVNMDGRRRAALRDACRKSGVSIVQFVHEPFAALYGFLRASEDSATLRRRLERKLVLVFDWGGGTLDLNLCRLTGDSLVQIGNDGTDDIGGDVFDERLRDAVLSRVQATREGGPGEPLPNALTRLLIQCERAKIDLSARPQVEIFESSFFRAPGEIHCAASLSRADLESATKHLITEGLDRVRRLLDANDFTPQQVALCLAVGGMVKMPAIRQRLHELFGPERVNIPDNAATLVAEGAAWVARDEARLTLAKQVELLLARNSVMTLMPAGTRMPREGEVQKAEFDLYCVDPTDGSAKLQIQVPALPGANVLPNDRRVPLSTLALAVDSTAEPFWERLRLSLAVDDNLILHVAARSAEKGDTAAAEIHGLEFGLALPPPQGGSIPTGEDVPAKREAVKLPIGRVTVRANVAGDVDWSLVPGEVLKRHDSVYSRGQRLDVQEHERLYYEPCAICHRSWSDPQCRCDSGLRTTRPA